MTSYYLPALNGVAKMALYLLPVFNGVAKITSYYHLYLAVFLTRHHITYLS